MKFLSNIFFLLLVFVIDGSALAQEVSPDGDASSFYNSTPVIGGDSTTLGSNSATVDLFTGTMKYSIPISVPAGRKGMAPKLSLNYRSSLMNGWLGIGWELEVGGIERNAKYGVDYNGDSYLLRLNGTTIELINNDGSYQAKIESAFFRIRANKDTSGRSISWEVTDKSGTRYLFGQTAESRQDDPGDPSRNIPADPNRVFKWCLDYVVDANGNFIQFFYFKDQGQIYLDHIDYTGNEHQGTVPDKTVTFLRDDVRMDTAIMGGTNFLIKTRYRLSQINVIAKGNLVRSYKMGYMSSAVTKQSLLETVQQLGKDGVTQLPTITMSYMPENSSPGFNYVTWTSPGRPKTYKLSDFNGDSKEDIMAIFGCDTFDDTTNMTVSTAPDEAFSSWLSLSRSAYRPESSIPGDFNGDGKADLLYARYVDNLFNLYVSINKSGEGLSNFESTQLWVTLPASLVTLGNAILGRTIVADFNGDGMADILISDFVGNLYLGISTGAGFSMSSTPWATVGNGNTQAVQRFKVGDFDGDGNADVLFINESGKLSIVLSKKTGVIVMKEVGTLGNGANFLNYSTGDFNGDGLSDVVYVHKTGDPLPAGSVQIALSSGSGFKTIPTSWATIGNGEIDQYNTKKYTFADFFGNGKTGMLYIEVGAAWTGWNLYVAISTGTSFTTPVKWGATPLVGGNNTTRYAFGDFDGDRKMDVMYMASDVPPYGIGYGPCNDAMIPKVHFANGADNGTEFSSNLCVKISNGIGGTTRISYKKSTLSSTKGPIPVASVSSIITEDGYDLNAASETTYEYNGGYYHFPERDFRGFNYVKVTSPEGSNGINKIEETWFYQGNGNEKDGQDGYLKGKPYHTRISDSNGATYAETTISYYEPSSNSGPYFTPISQIDNYFCDGTVVGPCNSTTAKRHMLIGYHYDNFGNIIREDQYGIVDLCTGTPPCAGSTSDNDDRTIIRSFAANETDWLVGLPAQETVYKGTFPLTDTANLDSTMIASSIKYCYDGVFDCSIGAQNQALVKGNLTWTVTLLDGIHDPTVKMVYDVYGNITSKADANGHVTTTEYDDSNTLPKKVTNPLGHPTIKQYYGIDGMTTEKGLYAQLMSIKDPNDAITQIEYDSFGRTKLVIAPDTSQTIWSYEDFGAVGVQNFKTVNAVGISTSTYFDGLGRTIITKKTGPKSKNILTKKKYSKFGKVSESSLPYFEGLETPRNIVYDYDALGRVSTITQPDGTREKTCYNNGITDHIDRSEHRKRETRDGYGRVVKIEEYLGTYKNCTDPENLYATTVYEYDVLGNLRFIIDAENNQTEMRYDSLGRKVYMRDPDMGTWTYEFDANGNLISQVDARAQQIIFSYDLLNRVTRKHYPSGTDIVFIYDEPWSTNAKGRLTTMSDASGKTTYYYDIMGRASTVTKNIDNKDYAIKNSYDQIGRLSKITYPDNESIIYSYDANSLSAVTDPTGLIRYVSYENYNSFGQPGTSTFGNHVNTEYQYNQQNNRLISVITSSPATGTPLLDLSYEYDNVGNVTSITDNVNAARSQGFIYDDISRLIQAQSTIYGPLFYAYNQIGNIVVHGTPAVPPSCSPGSTLNTTTDTCNSDPICSVGTFDPNQHLCVGTAVSYAPAVCLVGTSFNASLNQCTAIPTCSSGTYSATNNVCETTATPTCNASPSQPNITPSTFVAADDKCEYTINLRIPAPYNCGTNYCSSGWTQLSCAFSYAAGITNIRSVCGQSPKCSSGTYNITTNTCESSISASCPSETLLDGTLDLCYSTPTCSTGSFDSDLHQCVINTTVTTAASCAQGAALNVLTNFCETAPACALGSFFNPSNDQCTPISANVSFAYGTQPHAVATTSDGLSYSYDSNGNMISDGQRISAYDYDNSLQAITVLATGVTTSFVYDGGGIRVKRITPNNATIYIDNLYECNAEVCAKYIFANGTRIAHKISAANIIYYHQDHLGSTRIVTDINGTKLEDIYYYPFGSSHSDTGEVSMNHKYTSQEFDDETGLYYYGGRYYNARLGRFLSADTIVAAPFNPQALNRYSYVLNNPLRYIDPTGHFTDNPLWAMTMGDIPRSPYFDYSHAFPELGLYGYTNAMTFNFNYSANDPFGSLSINFPSYGMTDSSNTNAMYNMGHPLYAEYGSQSGSKLGESNSSSQDTSLFIGPSPITEHKWGYGIPISAADCHMGGQSGLNFEESPNAPYMSVGYSVTGALFTVSTQLDITSPIDTTAKSTALWGRSFDFYLGAKPNPTVADSEFGIGSRHIGGGLHFQQGEGLTGISIHIGPSWPPTPVYYSVTPAKTRR